MRHCGSWVVGAAVFAAGCASGCESGPESAVVHPSVAPQTQAGVSVALDGALIAPMYQELLAVDLPTVMRVAMARNLDIERARARVEANRGKYEANVEAIFPVIAPSIAYSDFRGQGQNANGTLTPTVHFGNLLPAISIQWILNPGAVIYDIVASKRRLEAAAKEAEMATLETARAAAVEYYELQLARAGLQVAQQAVSEAEELLRVTRSRVRTGTGLPAEESRAEADLARARQDVVAALNAFYEASVALTLTLHIDSSVTLVPADHRIHQITLVREDLSLGEMLESAARYRPDLEAARRLMRATEADSSASAWGDLGPQIGAGYEVNGIKTAGSVASYPWEEQQRAVVGASFTLGLSTFGHWKTAQANERLAGVDLARREDEARAAVIRAQQASAMHAKIIPMAHEQLESALEALRLTQANLRAGTGLLIDVLQAENSAGDARLRYAGAVIRYNQSQVNLLAALGILDETSDLVPGAGAGGSPMAVRVGAGPGAGE